MGIDAQSDLVATSARRSSRKTSARKPTRRIEVGVIAAAGKGTRAYPRTSFIPKPLFQFEKETILQRNVALQFEVLGVKKLFIIVGHLQEQVILEIERIRKLYPDREIEIAQWTKQGLAADVNNLRERIQGDFVLILGDEFYYQTNHRILKTEWQKQKKADALIAVLPSPLISEIRKNYSVLLRGTRVQKLVEKPQTPPNDLLGLGTYVFTPDFFTYFDKTPPSPRSGVIELTDVIDLMSQTGEVHATTLSGRYFNINSLADYYAATYLLRSEKFGDYRISMVIPAMNHESTIGDVIEDFQSRVDEILVVDMGSTDNTKRIVRSKKARLMEMDLPESERNVHHAPAIMQGMQHATGDILLLVPADGSFRAGDLPKLLEYLKDCDMAVGTRTTRQLMEQGSNLSALYRWLNVFFGKLVEIFWWGQEPRFTDIGCLYRAIWKDSFLKIAPELKARDKTYSIEMMIEIMRYHMRCIEVPVTFYRRYGTLQDETVKERWKYFFSVIYVILSRKFK